MWWLELTDSSLGTETQDLVLRISPRTAPHKARTRELPGSRYRKRAPTRTYKHTSILTNSVAVDRGEQTLFKILISVLLGVHPGIVGPQSRSIFNFEGDSTLFSMAAVSFHIPTDSV